MVLAEDPETQSPAEVTASDQFIPLPEMRNALRGLQNYWVKYSLKNDLPAGSTSEWVLKFSPSLSRAEVYLLQTDSVVGTYLTGFFVPPDQRSFAPTLKANIVRCFIPPGETRTVLVRARSDRRTIPPILDLQLKAFNPYFKALQKKKQGNALFYGFCLMMLIFTLILRFTSGDQTYAHYALYLVSFGFYTAYAAGDMYDLLIPALMPEHPQRIFLFKLILYGALIGYMSFFRAFLDLKQLLPFWDRAYRLLSWLAVPFMLLDLYLILTTNFSYRVSDKVTITYIFAFLSTLLPFVIVLYRTHDRKGYFVVAGLICMGLGILLTTFDRLRTVDFSIRSFEIGATIELIVFFIGLAYRQRLIRQEKQNTQLELQRSRLIQQQEHAEAERQRELNRLKSELYTNITHELRTPLTVINGMTEQIEGHQWEKDLIRRNTQNLLRLVNQVMDLSKLEAGRMELQLRLADVLPYLRYLCEAFHSGAESKGIQLAFHAEPGEYYMDFDSIKLQQIVYNLLSNALKFTPVGGAVDCRVAIHYSEEGEMLRFEVRDTGQGISEKELPLIFDRYFQSQVDQQQAYGGSGIGLALTKELVDLMKGRIEVNSVLDEGTTFQVYLPVTRQADLQKDHLPAIQLQSVPQAPPQASVALPNRHKDQARLLIIEDNPDVIAYMQTYLRKHYQLICAEDGKKGLEVAFETIPDLIISDVMMPGMDGFKVCDQLKTDLRTSHIPVILLTAKVTREDRLTGLEKGADAYLTKPFDEEELLLRIQQLLDLRQNLQQHFLRSGMLEQLKTKHNGEENSFLGVLTSTVLHHLADTGLSVNDLASAVNLGHSQLYRKLKALTGLTPLQFIKKIRLDQAAQLLCNPDLTVSEVAYSVGFNDPNYFSRSFQQHFGYPPREHQQRMEERKKAVRRGGEQG